MRRIIINILIIIFIYTTTYSQPCPDSLKILPNFINFGQKAPDSSRKIDVIILHSSFCPERADSFALPCILNLYKKYDVSAHYIITREGVVHQLVNEAIISFHGGKGILPDGRQTINTSSIGIELINSYTGIYTDLQYCCLSKLVKNIQQRYKINHIVCHSDVAPLRKTDPWNFDWLRFWNMIQEE
ncbi:MAG: N-acetylmuramoyl-L-alanine amidase [Cytophagales bacterium]|nr:N-acetylmuramoyl-L-alanine amidase [Cytophagales bacterium]